MEFHNNYRRNKIFSLVELHDIDKISIRSIIKVIIVEFHKRGRYDNKLYDASMYPPIEGVPPKFAILKRNEWMMEKADLIISCVKRTSGGAYKSLKKAISKKKKIINVCDYIQP